MKNRMLSLATAALAFGPAAAMAQQAAPNADANTPGVGAGQPVVNLPGPIDSPQDVLESARMAFVLADANGDGQISQKEANDAANLLVGGLFFRADADGDGKVTKEEANTAREEALRRQPVLRFVLDRASRNNAPEGAANAAQGTNPQQAAQALASMLDANNDGSLQANEVRQVVQTGVQTLFTAADTNRDGQLSPSELNAAMYGAVEAGLQAAFQAADQDKSGSLNKEEFSQAIVQPSYTVFDILDRDLDGQLTPRELNQAARIAAQQIEKMTVDVPANSPVNVIGSGRAPQGTDITLPGQPAQAAQPAQPARTTPAQPR